MAIKFKTGDIGYPAQGLENIGRIKILEIMPGEGNNCYLVECIDKKSKHKGTFPIGIIDNCYYTYNEWILYGSKI